MQRRHREVLPGSIISALKVRKIVADISIKVGADALIAAVPEIDILINNLDIYEAKPFAEILDED